MYKFEAETVPSPCPTHGGGGQAKDSITDLGFLQAGATE